MQQHNSRRFYISGTNGYTEWDSEGNKLIFHNYETNEKVKMSDPNLSNDDQFINQAINFLSITSSESHNELVKAKDSLLIVEAAKKSMKTGTEIKINNVI